MIKTVTQKFHIQQGPFKGEVRCNICHLPGEVTFKTDEHDPKTGRVIQTTETHTIGCGGHEHIHPALWNRHPYHWKYEKLENLRPLGWRGMR